MTPNPTPPTMGDGDNGNHATDPDYLLQRGMNLLQVLLSNGFDPLTEPLDLLIVGLIYPLCLQTITDDSAAVAAAQNRLTEIAQLVNIAPLRELREQLQQQGGAGGAQS